MHIEFTYYIDSAYEISISYYTDVKYLGKYRYYMFIFNYSHFSHNFSTLILFKRLLLLIESYTLQLNQ